MERPSVHNYSVADFLEQRAAGRLVINEDFQRRSIWKPAAKVYLIDSILRGFPIPKMYFRATVDPKTQTSVREVVDGQQRLRAIFDFADDKLRLTSRAGDLSGFKYSDLPEDLQSKFLSYTFVAEQLIDASDSDVLEVFARINTFNVALNPAELRHAQYQGDFKWLAHQLSRDFAPLWDQYQVLGLSQRARMADDALVADWVLQVIQGITGGEATALNKAYKNFDVQFDAASEVRDVLMSTVDCVQTNLSGALESSLSRPPHLTMLVAATAHVIHGLAVSPVDWLNSMEPLPARPTAPSSPRKWEQVAGNLLTLAEIIDLTDEPQDAAQRTFWSASRGATINLSSRAKRFPYYLQAFQ
ncbi:MAG: DUF262 domain-containing protein [Vicinamibacterales bacterium]